MGINTIESAAPDYSSTSAAAASGPTSTPTSSDTYISANISHSALTTNLPILKATSYSESLVQSSDAQHPANLIPSLCAAFYALGWVTGTGGGASIRQGAHIYLAPSGVQKEKITAADIFVLDFARREYVRRPVVLKPSACTPLFLEAFVRGAGCCIHTHSQWAVLVTLLVERDGRRATSYHGNNESGTNGTIDNGTVFEIEQIEQIKGIPRGQGKKGNLGYFDRLRIPIIENTAEEENLTSSLAATMDRYPDTYAVLVRRHGIYVWGDNVAKAKTQCESLDYIFQLAVRMRELGLPWVKDGPVG